MVGAGAAPCANGAKNPRKPLPTSTIGFRKGCTSDFEIGMIHSCRKSKN
jgi:hypothetical protein